ncbi:TPA: filamentous hemagglutinin, partial [Salmonella enterica]
TNGTGLFLGGNKTLSASNGSINLNGVSVAKSAIEIRGNNTLTADNINLTGNSTNGTGLQLNGNTTLNATNGSITGISQHGYGVRLKNLNINASGLNGTTTVSGIAKGNGNGVDISNVNLINV